jgi:hypothetical protein
MIELLEVFSHYAPAVNCVLLVVLFFQLLRLSRQR